MMKSLISLAIPTALAIALGGVNPAISQSVAIAPGSATVQLTGKSGGSRADGSCAGNISNTPNHTLTVPQDMNLRFTLQAEGGQPALLIRSPSGENFCVPADSYSNGRVVIPGRWEKGLYSIFVGDRANGSHSYTLSISAN